MKIIHSLLLKIALLSFLSLAIVPALAIVSASDSYAATSDSTEKNALSKVMCRALNIITGSAGKAFAAFAIISVGIGFFTGKVSWGLMIGVAAGIAAMFGASSIVSAISGDSKEVNCDDILLETTPASSGTGTGGTGTGTSTGA